MGKILKTTYHDTVQNITNFYSDLVNNPFYVFNDKKPVICTYYNINKDFSSLDPGSKIHMDNIGEESPIRYNRIYDFIIYGFTRIELNAENGDFGLEDERIGGECYILPNTIVPTEGDYFEVEHITDSTWLFMVTDVQKDTLDNGSNVYKIGYKLEYLDHQDIMSRIVYNFRLIDKREGTNIAKVVRCEDYDIAKLMDEQAVMLKDYYQELFYNRYVQTFVYVDLYEYRTYDPFMVEFLIRNKILDNGSESYVYVDHQLNVPKTFSIEYGKTFFRAFEKADNEFLMSSNRNISINVIKSYGTTFASRFEEYFVASYVETGTPGYHSNCFPDDLAIMIKEGTLIEDTLEVNKKSELWKNILIKHFTKQNFDSDEIKAIEDINFERSVEAFYLIPLLIFCLEQAIEKVLK